MHFKAPFTYRQALPETESEVTQALRTMRAYRDNNRFLRQVLVEQAARHRAEIQALHAQYRAEMQGLLDAAAA